jgi:DNA-binding LacI/PurR family transcriptional regulator
MASAHRVNIAEVATAAGVSVGTVSRVLNESPNVREMTRRRVTEVIKRLNYRPSKTAASLSRGSSRTVVILVPFLTRPSVVARLASAIRVFDDHGFDTLVRTVETAAQCDRHVAALSARDEADGAVVLSLRLNRVHLEALRSSRLPLTMVDTEAPGVPSTIVDDVRGGWLATEHLISLGHRRIAFVGDGRGCDLRFVSTRRRLLGYRRALEHHGLAYDPALVRLGQHSAASAAALTTRLLALAEPPTAIFASADTLAIGVLAAADQAGRAVPADLSVIGFDDLDAAAQLGLSTIHQPLAESGEHGGSRLCALIGGQPVGRLREELPLTVVARASTARLKWRPWPVGSGALQAAETPA